MTKMFIPGKLYIAKDTRMQDVGVYRCVTRSDSGYITIQKYDPDTGNESIFSKRRKIYDRGSPFGEKAYVDKGYPSPAIRGITIGEIILYAKYEYSAKKKEKDTDMHPFGL